MRSTWNNAQESSYKAVTGTQTQGCVQYQQAWAGPGTAPETVPPAVQGLLEMLGDIGPG